MRETIRNNWKKWIVNAVLNVMIASLIAGGYVKWKQLEYSVSQEELNQNIEEVLQRQKEFMFQNTQEHDKILFTARKYTDFKIIELEKREELKFNNIESMLHSSIANQTIIIKNLKEWVNVNEKRLLRLEEIQLRD